MLRELGQVGALLLVLLFCPKQNLRNLKKEVAGWGWTLWLSRDGSFSPSGTSRGGSPGRASLPRARPHAYLYFIKELGIQQGQLFSYFMAVKVMQGPRPGRQTPEVNGQGQLELSGPRS